MAGIEVSRSTVDQKISDAVIAVRSGFEKVDVIFNWLADNPVVNDVDPLTVPIGPSPDGMKTIGFGYTEDEAYMIRVLFEGLHAIDLNGLKTLGRKLTGLN